MCTPEAIMSVAKIDKTLYIKYSSVLVNDRNELMGYVLSLITHNSDVSKVDLTDLSTDSIETIDNILNM